ncbi:MAG: DUF494 family protein [Melioribacteraceae bacterium]|nr:DUF494 family protein [Melioribacteraceae bacterium]
MKNLNKENKFDKQTVSAAFSLVYDKIALNKIAKDITTISGSEGLRILSEYEIEAIGIDSYNYLIHVQNIGLIDSSDIEVLIEQILLYPTSQITLDDINWLILVSLVDYDSKILPGSRITLFSTDTIN